VYSSDGENKGGNSKYGVSSSGSATAGGIAGRLDGGKIKNCYSSGKVTAVSFATARMWSGGGFTCSASCSSYVGGIVGYLSSGSIENCFSIATVEAEADADAKSDESTVKAKGFAYGYGGKIVGYNSSSNNIVGCYYAGSSVIMNLTATSSTERNVNTSGSSKSSSYFSDETFVFETLLWDENIWIVDDTLPVLR